MSHWYTISIDFEAADIDDADHRHDEAVDALCGCEPGLHGNCINFVSSMRPATKEKDENFLDDHANPKHPYTPPPTPESTTGFADTPLRGEVEQFVGKLARHLPGDDGNAEDADEAPGITDITTELMRILLTTEEDRWVLDGDLFAKAVEAKASVKIKEAERDMQDKMHKFEHMRWRATSVKARRYLRKYKRQLLVREALMSRKALLVYFTILIFLGLLWMN